MSKDGDEGPTLTYHNIRFTEHLSKKEYIKNMIIYLLAVYGVYAIVRDITDVIHHFWGK